MLYGTILVDLERHRIVDLLPARSAATLAAWLQAHPGVEIIARDRAGAYADGARLGAPDAIQVADRFHLLRDLTVAIERSVTRHHEVIRSTAIACDAIPPRPGAAVRRRRYSGLPANQPGPTVLERQRADRRARRLARYEQVVALRAQGTPILAIARQLRIDPKTIRLWLAAGQFPERRRRRPLPTALDAFLDDVHERYDAGLENAAELTRALRPLGFTGSYQAVRRALYRLRRTRPCAVSARSDAHTAPRTSGCTPRATVWLLQRPSAELTDAERTYLERLTTACPALAGVRTLALAFRAMLRQWNPNGLRP